MLSNLRLRLRPCLNRFRTWLKGCKLVSRHRELLNLLGRKYLPGQAPSLSVIRALTATIATVKATVTVAETGIGTKTVAEISEIRVTSVNLEKDSMDVISGKMIDASGITKIGERIDGRTTAASAVWSLPPN